LTNAPILRITDHKKDFIMCVDACKEGINGVLMQEGVDSAGPANMLGDLLGKKSQLDLKLFGVGVPTVGSTVFP